eukprot:160346-Alexandrium_andersonii.AAC.1
MMREERIAANASGVRGCQRDRTSKDQRSACQPLPDQRTELPWSTWRLHGHRVGDDPTDVCVQWVEGFTAC